jgi:hypothetical protein
VGRGECKVAFSISAPQLLRAELGFEPTSHLLKRRHFLDVLLPLYRRIHDFSGSFSFTSESPSFRRDRPQLSGLRQGPISFCPPKLAIIDQTPRSELERQTLGGLSYRRVHRNPDASDCLSEYLLVTKPSNH